MRPVLHDLGGQGPLVLVSHATGFHGRAYAPLVSRLVELVRVVALDLPGHGANPLADGEAMRVLDLAPVVAEAVGSLPEQPHLFGHSVGAAVALLAATHRPGLLASAFVFEPAVFPAGPPDASEGRRNAVAGARRRTEVFASRAEALARFAGRGPLAELNAGSLAAYVEHGVEDQPDGTVRLRCRRDTEAAVYETCAELTVELLAPPGLRATLAFGERSAPATTDRQTDLLARIPHARSLSIPGVGHLGPLEHPPSVATALLDHLVWVGALDHHPDPLPAC
ncbi:MAG: alpha/beta fold hydrolase [Acidimicrobiales bacterium]